MIPNVIQFCCFALDDKCEFANICIENGIDVRYDEEMRNVPKNSTKYAWENVVKSVTKERTLVCVKEDQ